MISDLLDLASSGFWKLVALFALMALGSGLYIWASHERRAYQHEQQKKLERERQTKQRQIDSIYDHLKRRQRQALPLAFRTQSRNFLLLQTHPRYGGMVRLHEQGLEYIAHRRRRRKGVFFRDTTRNGLDDKDVVGSYIFRGTTFTEKDRESWENVALIPKRSWAKLYKNAFLSALRAISQDRRHLEKVTSLRNTKGFSFQAQVRRRSWAVWKRKSQTVKVAHQDGALLLIYDTQFVPYGCHRNRFLPWKKRCQGIEERQTLFIDKGLPGLNPAPSKDEDLHGVRTLRNGKPYSEKGLRPISSHSLQQLFALRQQYQHWVELATLRKPPMPRALTPIPRQHISAPPSTRPSLRAPAFTPPQLSPSPSSPSPIPTRRPASSPSTPTKRSITSSDLPYIPGLPTP